MSEVNLDSNSSKIIYYMDQNQKIFLERYIDFYLKQMKKFFQKDEVLKFLYKSIFEGKIDFFFFFL